MGQTNCTRNVSQLNSTTPCYIDTTNNRIWMRLPHFSGTKPSISGSLITASSTDGSSSGSSGVSPTIYTVTSNLLAEGYTRTLAKNGKLKMNISNEWHYLNVTNIKESTVTIIVSSTPQEVVLSVNETRKFDLTSDSYYDLSAKLNSITSNATRASITVKSIHEQITGASGGGNNTQAGEVVGEGGGEVTGGGEKELTCHAGRFDHGEAWALSRDYQLPEAL